MHIVHRGRSPNILLEDHHEMCTWPCIEMIPRFCQVALHEIFTSKVRDSCQEFVGCTPKFHGALKLDIRDQLPRPTQDAGKRLEKILGEVVHPKFQLETCEE